MHILKSVNLFSETKQKRPDRNVHKYWSIAKNFDKRLDWQ